MSLHARAPSTSYLLGLRRHDGCIEFELRTESHRCYGWEQTAFWFGPALPKEHPASQSRVALVLSLGGLTGIAGPAQAAAITGYQRQQTPLDTGVSATSPLPGYPRPQMMRPDWLSLNGQWDFTAAANDQPLPSTQPYSATILVPFPT